MRVLFVHPEHYLNAGIPGGIAVLAAILKQHGHTVRVFDTAFLKADPAYDQQHGDGEARGGSREPDTAGLQMFKATAYTIEDLVANDPVVACDDEFQKAIDSFSPDLIAVSSMTSTFDFSLDLLKSVRHHAKIIVGGVHATIATDDVLAHGEVDIACIGEADEVLPELCDLMEADKDYTNVLSMCFRMPDGRIKRNPLARRVDLNELPCPDWSLFDERHLFRPFEGTIYRGSFYVQSRGCPQHCTYCINSTVAEMTGGQRGYFRLQKPSVTAAHIRELKEKHDATWFKFADDSFLLPPIAHLEELADTLKPASIQFGCSVLPNTITEEKVRLAADMGCVAMSVGIESGNVEIRRRIGRRYVDDRLIDDLNMIRDYGIRVSTFNIIGFPGETRRNVFETIELNRRAGTSAPNVYILYPYPGTPIQREHDVPLRGKDGRIVPVSEAKHVGLSEMGADELEGLLNTFNLYTNLPKSLWPVIEIAESPTDAGHAVLGILRSYTTMVLSGEPITTISLTDVPSVKGAGPPSAGDRAIPLVLAEILTMHLEPDDLKTAIDALCAFTESR